MEHNTIYWIHKVIKHSHKSELSAPNQALLIDLHVYYKYFHCTNKMKRRDKNVCAIAHDTI